MQVVLASNNNKKIKELQTILPTSIEILTAAKFSIKSPPETGLSFVENALIKARHTCEITGLPAVADDSGIEVDYLNGQPGIHSARYAGSTSNDSDNNNKLLKQLQGVSQAQRTARFRCVIVFLRHALDPMPLIASGTWEGEILTTARGDNGFGYDPLFFVPALDKSSAQLTAEHKNQISHRAQAIKQLRTLFDQHFAQL
ncbi:MAG: RdgB/HAM1 family non-canonical purine NTP pyrophosphatase [Pseudomonadales bacterium]|nr:RdgB/HAM1 family non-canonical purine NTP pyrophosphatase [Pseudomonadales bacterium]